MKIRCGDPWWEKPKEELYLDLPGTHCSETVGCWHSTCTGVVFWVIICRNSRPVAVTHSWLTEYDPTSHSWKNTTLWDVFLSFSWKLAILLCSNVFISDPILNCRVTHLFIRIYFVTSGKHHVPRYNTIHQTTALHGKCQRTYKVSTPHIKHHVKCQQSQHHKLSVNIA